MSASAKERSFARRALPGALIAGSLAVAVLLFANIPDFSEIPFWMWGYQPAAWPRVVLALLCVALPASLVSIFAVRCLQRGRLVLGMAIFISLGAVTSNALLPVVTGEWRAIALSLANTGHAGLSIKATQVDAGQIAHEYEQLVTSRALGPYGVTKGPGVVLFYHALGRASEVGPLASVLESGSSLHDFSGTPYKKLPAFATLIWIVFSLLPWLTILPLYWMLGAVLDARAAAWGPALFLSIPAPLLATFHADGALVMPLFALVAALALRAAVDRRWGLALASGALCGLASWVAPALLASLALVIAPGAIGLVRSRIGSEHACDIRRSSLINLGVSMLGFVLVLAALYLAFGYDLVERLRVSTRFHAAWRPGIEPGVWLLASLLEFALYLGPVVLVAAAYRALRDAVRPREMLASPIPALAVFALLGALALQHHQPETIRLWLFMTPLCAWAALQGFEQVTAGDDAVRKRVLSTAVGCGYFMAVVLSATRPFYWV